MKCPRRSLSASALIAFLSGGCATSRAPRVQHAAGAALSQRVRFSTLQQARLKEDSLFLAGIGYASADNDKNLFSARGLLSGDPRIELTILSRDAEGLKACRQRAQAAQENREPLEILGQGTFRIESEIDPPLETGVFKLSRLVSCGGAPAASAASPAVANPAAPASGGAVSAADLVAVPERYLERPAVIEGRLSSPVHFADAVSRLTLQSEGQFLSGYFATPSLPAESRLALVHAAPGSRLTLQGTLARLGPKSLGGSSGSGTDSGYEFDISKVIWVEPAAP